MAKWKPPVHLARQPYVYVIGGSDQRFVKIGVSTNPKGRHLSIQTGCPFPLSILWLAEGDHKRESALHECFADRRVQGEWFEFPDGNAVALISEAFAEMYPQPLGVHLQPWTVPPDPPKLRRRPEPPGNPSGRSLTLSDGSTMTYEEVMAAIAVADAANPRPRVTREESWAAVLQHLRDQGSRC
jgi:hypothetical protein